MDSKTIKKRPRSVERDIPVDLVDLKDMKGNLVRPKKKNIASDVQMTPTTPVTHSGERGTSSSSEDIVANALTYSQEEIQEAQCRAEEANAHLRAVQERLDGRVDDRDENCDQSEPAVIGVAEHLPSPASVIIQMENIPLRRVVLISSKVVLNSYLVRLMRVLGKTRSRSI